MKYGNSFQKMLVKLETDFFSVEMPQTPLYKSPSALHGPTTFQKTTTDNVQGSINVLDPQ